MSLFAPNFHLSEQKNQLWVAGIATLFFVIVAMPSTYQITNYFTKNTQYSFVDKVGKPNVYGLTVHSIVFFALVFIYLSVITTQLPNGY